MNNIRKISTLASLSFLAVAVSTPARLSPPVLEYSEIDAYIEAQMRAWNIPGTALVIVQDGQVAHLKTFGQAGKDRPVTPQTPFEIGSCSKSFTALAVMQLVEAGQVDLDKPVQVYLPWFRVADAKASARITVRHLLNHTSGLSNEIDARAWINPRNLSLEDWGKSLQWVHISATPGTHYQYSNFNYMLLALVIEAVSGQSYGAYLSQHIFSPLDMRNSFTDPALARTYGLADGYTWWFGIPLRSLEKPRPDVLGAGYIMVSPEDIAHFLSMQLNDGLYKNIRLLSAEGITAMHTPPQLPAESSLYGMGWVNYQEGGQNIINHNGRSASFTSSIFMLPELKLGIAVMVNVTSTLAPHTAWSMAYNVKNWIVSGQQAQVDPSFRDFYLPWVGGFLGTTAVVLWRLSRPLDRPKKNSATHIKHRTVLSLGFDALLALAALFGQPMALGWHKWRGLFVYQPDAAYWCLIAGILLSGKLLLRALGIVRGGRKTRS